MGSQQAQLILFFQLPQHESEMCMLINRSVLAKRLLGRALCSAFALGALGAAGCATEDAAVEGEVVEELPISAAE